MKVKFGALVTDGRGKLGGAVFQGNNGAISLRTSNVIKGKFQYSRQLSLTRLSVLAGLFRSLTASQLAYVVKFSKIYIKKDGSHPTPYELFISHAMIFDSVNLYRPTNLFYNIPEPAGQSVSFSATQSGASLTVTFASRPLLNSFYLLRFSRNCSTLVAANAARPVNVFYLFSTGANPVQVRDYYFARFKTYFTRNYFISCEAIFYDGGNPFILNHYKSIIQVT